VCSGSCILEQEGQQIHLKQGDSFAIAAAAERWSILPEEETELVIVYPGKDMEK